MDYRTVQNIPSPIPLPIGERIKERGTSSLPSATGEWGEVRRGGW